MFKTLFALGLKLGLVAAERDVRFQAFKLAYNELEIGDILFDLAKKSDNDLDNKAVKAIDDLLREDE